MYRPGDQVYLATNPDEIGTLIDVKNRNDGRRVATVRFGDETRILATYKIRKVRDKPYGSPQPTFNEMYRRLSVEWGWPAKKVREVAKQTGVSVRDVYEAIFEDDAPESNS